jgi:hypothetical protein
VIDAPDETSIITYLVSYYHHFAQMAQEGVSGKRLQKIVQFEMDISAERERYELGASSLLEWLQLNIDRLGAIVMPNTVPEAQALSADFQRLGRFGSYMFFI